MPHRRYLNLDSLRLSYLEAGIAKEGSPSLVLLHGLMGSAATFLPFMNEFDEGVHVIALDLPGSGSSERRADIEADLESVTSCVARALDSLKLEKPIVLGHSHGGTIALRLAATRPDRLTSLALLAPAHPYFVEADGLIRFYLSLPGRMFAQTMPWFPQWLQMIGLRRMAGPQSWDTAERLAPYRQNLRTPGTISHLLKLIGTWGEDMASLRRLLCKPVTTPTLVVWGDCDRAVPVHSAGALCASLLESELHVLPGVGHRPAEEVPAMVAELVEQMVVAGGLLPRAATVYRPNAEATHVRIAPLMTSSFEAGD